MDEEASESAVFAAELVWFDLQCVMTFVSCYHCAALKLRCPSHFFGENENCVDLEFSGKLSLQKLFSDRVVDREASCMGSTILPLMFTWLEGRACLSGDFWMKCIVPLHVLRSAGPTR